MAKSKFKQKNTQVAEQKPAVVEYGRLVPKSIAKAARENPAIVDKLNDFIELKKKNHLAPYGGNDKPFVSGGNLGRNLPKARKAHLTDDYSVIYEVSGKDPVTIKIDGVFSHADLGTGNPPNINIQRNMSTRIANARLEEDELY